MDNRKNEKEKRGLPTQMNLVIRTVAGVYLIYLAYSIFNSLSEAQGMEKALFAAIVVLFAVIGAAVAFFSLRSISRGEYAGGSADSGKNGEEKEEEAAETEGAAQERIRFEEPEKTAEEEDS